MSLGSPFKKCEPRTLGLTTREETYKRNENSVSCNNGQCRLAFENTSSFFFYGALSIQQSVKRLSRTFCLYTSGLHHMGNRPTDHFAKLSFQKAFNSPLKSTLNNLVQFLEHLRENRGQVLRHCCLIETTDESLHCVKFSID